MTKPSSALAKPSQPVRGIVTIDGKRYQVESLQIIQHDDPRPSHYQTAKSQGLPPQSLKLPKLPSALSLSLAAVVAISFLVAASMFSISLTAYSNSIDRIDQNRSFFEVE